MALTRYSIHDRELNKFVESPSRPGEPAVEVVDTESHDILQQILGSLNPEADNIRSKILAAVDRIQTITYADFGTKNQRVTQINYTAASVGSEIAQKIFSYSLVGNRYRRDTITWNIV